MKSWELPEGTVTDWGDETGGVPVLWKKKNLTNYIIKESSWKGKSTTNNPGGKGNRDPKTSKGRSLKSRGKNRAKKIKLQPRERNNTKAGHRKENKGGKRSRINHTQRRERTGNRRGRTGLLTTGKEKLGVHSRKGENQQ